jgi:hypothetical protein
MPPGPFGSQVGLRTALPALRADETLATVLQVNADHHLFQTKVHRFDLPRFIQT